jgi:thioredoxin reductase (NADPH)
VGAGPAGISAALWARTFGFEPLLIESGGRPGGQLLRVHFEIANLPGRVTGTGEAIAARCEQQLAAAHVPVLTGVEAVDLDDREPCVITRAGEPLVARAIVIATGLRRRRLQVPGERELEGRGVSYSATADRAQLAGRDVVVVGGGDAAFENALILAQAGCRVGLIVRGAVRARTEFRERVAEERRIERLDGAAVRAVVGHDHVTAVRIEDGAGTWERPTEAVVVKIGNVPNTEWCPRLARDEEGYLRVNASLRTSHPRVWAVGDVTRPAVFAASVAIGQGALALEAVRGALRGT